MQLSRPKGNSFIGNSPRERFLDWTLLPELRWARNRKRGRRRQRWWSRRDRCPCPKRGLSVCQRSWQTSSCPCTCKLRSLVMKQRKWTSSNNTCALSRSHTHTQTRRHSSCMCTPRPLLWVHPPLPPPSTSTHWHMTARSKAYRGDGRDMWVGGETVLI